ncbi:Similar to ZNF157: Zinc finger protein 157 (Homo sapiens) [Cotesia congregata]|uniref:Similar to ZNF157: Zinc finger protein 157 (Homo sapiens) n=1 Tax=Cotesia congregata TaxID=51543 RepID=A0A8J2E9S3_COTCN|nr:Similar to ZNF157: Zinc finger protein 157 (Homo sapiens) [Cotesia congregata]
MSVINFVSNPFVIKIEKIEPEENRENGPKELPEEYPIDLEEIKVEGNQNTTTSDDVNHDYHPEDDNSEKIFVVDGIVCEKNPENDFSGKKKDPMSKCEICNKEYSKYYMKEHHRRHTGEKRHKCEKCPAKFVRKSNLTKHMLTHTGKKPYQCSICLSNFRGKATLNRHTMIHTGEKPWQCRLCPMKFRDKSTMVGHEALHTADYDYKPFQCNFCPLKFRFRSSLNQHRYIHAPEKPFQCHDCGNKYYSKKSLRAHLKAHP